VRRENERKKKGEKEKKIKENKINFFVKLSVLKL